MVIEIIRMDDRQKTFVKCLNENELPLSKKRKSIIR